MTETPRREFLRLALAGALASVSGALESARAFAEPLGQPAPFAPENVTVLLARGPFTVDDEIALLEERRIELMVTRNSGARATAAKLEAARRLGIPVVMVRRPVAPLGEQVATVREALDRINLLSIP